MHTIPHTAQAIQDAWAAPAERREKRQCILLLQGGWTFSLGQDLKLVLGYAMVGGLAVMMASTFIACSFNPPGLPLDCPPPGCPIDFNDGKWIPEEIDLIAETAPLATPTEEQQWPVKNGELSSDFASYHGYSCAEAERAWVELPNGEDIVGISIQHSIPLPSPNHTGMVYMNGWELAYTGSDDHHVQGLGAWITKVRQENDQLHWEAGGVLADKNADDPYTWCYYYTVVIWDHTAIPANVAQENVDHSQTFVHERAQTASIRELRWAHEIPGQQPKADVPRGFGLMFNGGADHHLLQAAFDLDEVQRVLVGRPDRIAWNASTILKDNGARSFLGTAMISVVGGSGARMRRDYTFDLQPRIPASGGCIKPPSTHAQWVTVPDLSFDYAVPVLAGWDIGYPCGDHEVKKIGAQITDFDYEKAPGASTGTLRYRVASVLQDKNADDGLRSRYKVNILGFNRD